eukprot:TRINITY_DN5601_c0_g1_i1.p1 TRINITY_DN5601_c0_g1~~TRINITY_DN5601_c0_g1_i1.p1  ORF type:complete len:3019 (+),score=961.94 TRINITY_DN5601_c0_g1_i1:41-9097(+)
MASLEAEAATLIQSVQRGRSARREVVRRRRAEEEQESADAERRAEAARGEAERRAAHEQAAVRRLQRVGRSRAARTSAAVRYRRRAAGALQRMGRGARARLQLSQACPSRRRYLWSVAVTQGYVRRHLARRRLREKRREHIAGLQHVFLPRVAVRSWGRGQYAGTFIRSVWRRLAPDIPERIVVQLQDVREDDSMTLTTDGLRYIAGNGQPMVDARFRLPVDPDSARFTRKLHGNALRITVAVCIPPESALAALRIQAAWRGGVGRQKASRMSDARQGRRYFCVAVSDGTAVGAVYAADLTDASAARDGGAVVVSAAAGVVAVPMSDAVATDDPTYSYSPRTGLLRFTVPVELRAPSSSGPPSARPDAEHRETEWGADSSDASAAQQAADRAERAGTARESRSTAGPAPSDGHSTAPDAQSAAGSHGAACPAPAGAPAEAGPSETGSSGKADGRTDAAAERIQAAHRHRAASAEERLGRVHDGQVAAFLTVSPSASDSASTPTPSAPSVAPAAPSASASSAEAAAPSVSSSVSTPTPSASAATSSAATSMQRHYRGYKGRQSALGPAHDRQMVQFLEAGAATPSSSGSDPLTHAELAALRRMETERSRSPDVLWEFAVLTLQQCGRGCFARRRLVRERAAGDAQDAVLSAMMDVPESPQSAARPDPGSDAASAPPADGQAEMSATTAAPAAPPAPAAATAPGSAGTPEPWSVPLPSTPAELPAAAPSPAAALTLAAAPTPAAAPTQMREDSTKPSGPTVPSIASAVNVAATATATASVAISVGRRAAATATAPFSVGVGKAVRPGVLSVLVCGLDLRWCAAAGVADDEDIHRALVSDVAAALAADREHLALASCTLGSIVAELRVDGLPEYEAARLAAECDRLALAGALPLPGVEAALLAKGHPPTLPRPLRAGRLGPAVAAAMRIQRQAKAWFARRELARRFEARDSAARAAEAAAAEAILRNQAAAHTVLCASAGMSVALAAERKARRLKVQGWACGEIQRTVRGRQGRKAAATARSKREARRREAAAKEVRERRQRQLHRELEMVAASATASAAASAAAADCAEAARAAAESATAVAAAAAGDPRAFEAAFARVHQQREYYATRIQRRARVWLARQEANRRRGSRDRARAAAERKRAEQEWLLAVRRQEAGCARLRRVGRGMLGRLELVPAWLVEAGRRQERQRRQDAYRRMVLVQSHELEELDPAPPDAPHQHHAAAVIQAAHRGRIGRRRAAQRRSERAVVVPFLRRSLVDGAAALFAERRCAATRIQALARGGFARAGMPAVRAAVQQRRRDRQREEAAGVVTRAALCAAARDDAARRRVVREGVRRQEEWVRSLSDDISGARSAVAASNTMQRAWRCAVARAELKRRVRARDMRVFRAAQRIQAAERGRRRRRWFAAVQPLCQLEALGRDFIAAAEFAPRDRHFTLFLSGDEWANRQQHVWAEETGRVPIEAVAALELVARCSGEAEARHELAVRRLQGAEEIRRRSVPDGAEERRRMATEAKWERGQLFERERIAGFDTGRRVLEAAHGVVVEEMMRRLLIREAWRPMVPARVPSFRRVQLSIAAAEEARRRQPVRGAEATARASLTAAAKADAELSYRRGGRRVALLLAEMQGQEAAARHALLVSASAARDAFWAVLRASGRRAAEMVLSLQLAEAAERPPRRQLQAESMLVVADVLRLERGEREAVLVAGRLRARLRIAAAEPAPRVAITEAEAARRAAAADAFTAAALAQWSSARERAVHAVVAAETKARRSLEPPVIIPRIAADWRRVIASRAVWEEAVRKAVAAEGASRDAVRAAESGQRHRIELAEADFGSAPPRIAQLVRQLELEEIAARRDAAGRERAGRLPVTQQEAEERVLQHRRAAEELVRAQEAAREAQRQRRLDEERQRQVERDRLEWQEGERRAVVLAKAANQLHLGEWWEDLPRRQAEADEAASRSAIAAKATVNAVRQGESALRRTCCEEDCQRAGITARQAELMGRADVGLPGPFEAEWRGSVARAELERREEVSRAALWVAAGIAGAEVLACADLPWREGGGRRRLAEAEREGRAIVTSAWVPSLDAVSPDSMSTARMQRELRRLHARPASAARPHRPPSQPHSRPSTAKHVVLRPVPLVGAFGGAVRKVSVSVASDSDADSAEADSQPAAAAPDPAVTPDSSASSPAAASPAAASPAAASPAAASTAASAPSLASPTAPSPEAASPSPAVSTRGQSGTEAASPAAASTAAASTAAASTAAASTAAASTAAASPAAASPIDAAPTSAAGGSEASIEAVPTSSPSSELGYAAAILAAACGSEAAGAAAGRRQRWFWRESVSVGFVEKSAREEISGEALSGAVGLRHDQVAGLLWHREQRARSAAAASEAAAFAAVLQVAAGGLRQALRAQRAVVEEAEGGSRDVVGRQQMVGWYKLADAHAKRSREHWLSARQLKEDLLAQRLSDLKEARWQRCADGENAAVAAAGSAGTVLRSVAATSDALSPAVAAGERGWRLQTTGGQCSAERSMVTAAGSTGVGMHTAGSDDLRTARSTAMLSAEAGSPEAVPAPAATAAEWWAAPKLPLLAGSTDCSDWWRDAVLVQFDSPHSVGIDAPTKEEQGSRALWGPEGPRPDVWGGVPPTESEVRHALALYCASADACGCGAVHPALARVASATKGVPALFGKHGFTVAHKPAADHWKGDVATRAGLGALAADLGAPLKRDAYSALLARLRLVCRAMAELAFGPSPHLRACWSVASLLQAADGGVSVKRATAMLCSDAFATPNDSPCRMTATVAKLQKRYRWLRLGPVRRLAGDPHDRNESVLLPGAADFFLSAGRHLLDSELSAPRRRGTSHVTPPSPFCTGLCAATAALSAERETMLRSAAFLREQTVCRHALDGFGPAEATDIARLGREHRGLSAPANPLLPKQHQQLWAEPTAEAVCLLAGLAAQRRDGEVWLHLLQEAAAAPDFFELLQSQGPATWTRPQVLAAAAALRTDASSDISRFLLVRSPVFAALRTYASSAVSAATLLHSS